jgi:hypothetical protein
MTSPPSQSEEFDGGHSRAEAERFAWGDRQTRWHLAHGERVPPDICAGCRRPIGAAEALDLIDGCRVHFGGFDCLTQHGTRWRAAATRALIALGLKPPVERESPATDSHLCRHHDGMALSLTFYKLGHCCVRTVFSEERKNTTMKLFVYSVGIIDDWYGRRLFSEIAPRDDEGMVLEGPSTEILAERFKLAGAAAREMFWEGDVTCGPYWAPIPISDDPGASEFVIGWKQSNNGATFIASPFPLQ